MGLLQWYFNGSLVAYWSGACSLRETESKWKLPCAAWTWSAGRLISCLDTQHVTVWMIMLAYGRGGLSLRRYLQQMGAISSLQRLLTLNISLLARTSLDTARYGFVKSRLTLLEALG